MAIIIHHILNYETSTSEQLGRNPRKAWNRIPNLQDKLANKALVRP